LHAVAAAAEEEKEEGKGGKDNKYRRRRWHLGTSTYITNLRRSTTIPGSGRTIAAK
jgi:hypothetical protein